MEDSKWPQLSQTGARNQEPPLCWWQGGWQEPKYLEHLPLPSQVYEQGAGSEAGQPATQTTTPIWDACSAPTLAPACKDFPLNNGVHRLVLELCLTIVCKNYSFKGKNPKVACFFLLVDIKQMEKKRKQSLKKKMTSGSAFDIGISQLC